MRGIVGKAVVAFLAGGLLSGAALAGVVVDPFGTANDSPTEAVDGALGGERARPEKARGPKAKKAPQRKDAELTPAEIPAAAAADVDAPAAQALPPGTFLVGAARASLAPAPEVFGGEQWQRQGCTVYGTEGNPALDADHAVASMQDLHGWPAASPDCVYLGGFGIGPVRPAQRVGQGGVWVRALAVSNGEQTFAYAIADTVGWFARYDSRECPTDDCGILDVRQRLSSDLGVDLANLVIGSTHTHAGADSYGGWGGIPDWYRAQLRDAAVGAVKQAVRNMRKGTIRVGDVSMPDRNGQRRDTYYSNADTEATWLQAVDDDGETIATLGTFAAHPTIVNDPILHADWPGAAARRFEDRYGGVGLMFEGGLGNVSVDTVGSGSDEARAEATGVAVADGIVSDIEDDGTVLTSNVMAARAPVVHHPVTTNMGLITLATAGFFDREFTPGTEGAGPPSEYSWSMDGETSTAGEDNDPDGPVATRSCVSAGPTIVTTAGAHRIGDFAVAFAPGEIFSNIAEVVKEEAGWPGTTMVLGQSNDALGYLIQSFEYDTAANVVTEYGTQTHEYEEVFSTDRCIGDHVLETVLESIKGIGAAAP